MAEPADLIRHARRRSRLTQAEFARRANTTQSAVSAYESGARSPSVATLRRLLRIAGLELEAAPRVRSLRSLVAEHRDEIARLAARRGARNVRLFGSVARGDDSPGSDIDLLVDLDPDRSLLDLAALREDLHDLLGTSVDVATLPLLRDRVRPAVEEEAVPL